MSDFKLERAEKRVAELEAENQQLKARLITAQERIAKAVEVLDPGHCEWDDDA